MSPGGTTACVISWYNASRLSGGAFEGEGFGGFERRKSWHQHHAGSSPRRPNTATRSLHRSAVAGCTCIDTGATIGPDTPGHVFRAAGGRRPEVRELVWRRYLPGILTTCI